MSERLPLIVIILALLAFPMRAHAYLDPGTGSYFFQILIAVVVSGLFVIKTRLKNIKARLAGLFSVKKKNNGHKA